MKKVTWEVTLDSLPAAVRYCKKCSRKQPFACSRQFRVNAQRKYLDIWLIYKCPDCDTTWNAAVCSRVSPQALRAEVLNGFYKNDGGLAERYACDWGFLKRNGAETEMPLYSVSGDTIFHGGETELEIKTRYPIPIKISAVVRRQLELSQKEYVQMIEEGKIKNSSGVDLKKGKLNEGVTLIIKSQR